MGVRSVTAVVLALALLGCGGGGGPDPDGGAADAGAPEPDAGAPGPAAPAAPAPPAWACPDGWTEPADVPGACEPWPASAPDCPDGAWRVPGEPTCAPFGAACPDPGAWPADLPADGVRYVDAAAAAGGDGSAGAPFATIAEALAGAASGDLVAVAAGRYVETIDVPAGVTVRGACAAETIIRAPDDAEAFFTVNVGGEGVGLLDLTVEGPNGGLRVVGRARAERVRVRDVTQFGIVVIDGGDVTLEDAIVREIRPSVEVGGALVALGAGALRMRRCVVEGAEQTAITAIGEGTRLEMTDCHVRDSVEHAGSGMGGLAVALGEGSTARLERVLLEDNLTAHVFAQTGGRLDAADLVLRGLSAVTPEGSATASLSALGGFEVSVQRALFQNQRSAGVAVLGATLALEDAFIVDVSGTEPAPEAAGFLASMASTVSLARVRIARVENVALAVDLLSSATVEDLDVEDVATARNGIAGRGLNVTEGATAALDRVRLRRTTEVAVLVTDSETALDARDLAIEDVRSRPDGLGGRGMTVRGTARATLERVTIERAREVGVLVWGEGTRATLTDVRIEETLPRACEEDTCAGFGAGTSLAVTDAATVTLESFVVRRSTLAGVQIVDSPDVTLMNGLVAENPVGMNLQGTTPELAQLTTGVRYVDNDTNLDSATLPVPEPLDAP